MFHTFEAGTPSLAIFGIESSWIAVCGTNRRDVRVRQMQTEVISSGMALCGGRFPLKIYRPLYLRCVLATDRAVSSDTRDMPSGNILSPENRTETREAGLKRWTDILGTDWLPSNCLEGEQLETTVRTLLRRMFHDRRSALHRLCVGWKATFPPAAGCHLRGSKAVSGFVKELDLATTRSALEANADKWKSQNIPSSYKARSLKRVNIDKESNDIRQWTSIADGLQELWRRRHAISRTDPPT